MLYICVPIFNVEIASQLNIEPLTPTLSLLTPTKIRNIYLIKYRLTDITVSYCVSYLNKIVILFVLNVEAVTLSHKFGDQWIWCWYLKFTNVIFVLNFNKNVMR